MASACTASTSPASVSRTPRPWRTIRAVPDLALELGHVVGHRRLRVRQRPGGSGQGAVPGDLLEDAEPLRADHGPSATVRPKEPLGMSQNINTLSSPRSAPTLIRCIPSSPPAAPTSTPPPTACPRSRWPTPSSRPSAPACEGQLDPHAVDDGVAVSRAHFADLVGATADRVAINSQASPLVGLVAEALPAGAVVLIPEGEFTSVLWPFLARAERGELTVHTVPVGRLPEAVATHPGRLDLVACSVVQSADGTVTDPGPLTAAAHARGARTLFDVTQAAGWLPLAGSPGHPGCTEADWVVGGGYKWLLAPRGTAFLAGTTEALGLLRPVAAGWYAGDEPWQSVYGGPLRLATSARRLDISPAWPAWVGQRVALELLAGIGVEATHRHDLGLANRLRAGLGQPRATRPSSRWRCPTALPSASRPPASRPPCGPVGCASRATCTTTRPTSTGRSTCSPIYAFLSARARALALLCEQHSRKPGAGGHRGPLARPVGGRRHLPVRPHEGP